MTAEQTIVIAKMLAGYDEAIWNKLRADRKRTYIRAAWVLGFFQKEILAKLAEFECEEKKK